MVEEHVFYGGCPRRGRLQGDLIGGGYLPGAHLKDGYGFPGSPTSDGLAVLVMRSRSMP